MIFLMDFFDDHFVDATFLTVHVVSNRLVNCRRILARTLNSTLRENGYGDFLAEILIREYHEIYNIVHQLLLFCTFFCTLFVLFLLILIFTLRTQTIAQLENELSMRKPEENQMNTKQVKTTQINLKHK